MPTRYQVPDNHADSKIRTVFNNTTHKKKNLFEKAALTDRYVLSIQFNYSHKIYTLEGMSIQYCKDVSILHNEKKNGTDNTICSFTYNKFGSCKKKDLPTYVKRSVLSFLFVFIYLVITIEISHTNARTSKHT